MPTDFDQIHLMCWLALQDGANDDSRELHHFCTKLLPPVDIERKADD